MESVKNAIISSAEIIYERDFLSFSIHTDSNGMFQACGFLRLDSPTNERTHGAKIIGDIMKTFEVEKWSDLEGKNCRVLRKNDDWNSSILGLAHIVKPQSVRFINGSLYQEKDPELARF